MAWEVEFTDEFEVWWNALTEQEQDSVNDVVTLLQKEGPLLGRPHADSLKGSKIVNLKELRIQHQGRPFRVLFVFDPRRTAMLLVGGDKTGTPRWYEEMIPQAEKIYAQHLSSLEDKN